MQADTTTIPDPPEPDSRRSRDGEGTVRLIAQAAFPTLFGTFTLMGYADRTGGDELTAVVRGDVRGATDCPIRVHSECHTGDIFGSLRCDCREQLEESLRYIAARECGAVIYLRQEGRGIGLLNKIRAYELQDQGLDSVDANERLGFPADARDYATAARIIELLGIASVRLLTNNPAKISGLEQEGIKVTGRVPIVVPANRFNERYLATKRTRFNHLL
jgi:GTP cyclohydrolase II